jgi:hypothetical protein
MRNRAGLLQIKPRCLVEEESADEVIDKSTDFRCWHFSDLTGRLTMSVLEGKADFPVARPDF